jgi:hypothetical protein
MSSTYLFLPYEDNLEDVFHVFAYLGLHHNARVVFDPTYPSVIKTDWKSMYVDAKEMIPSDDPVSRGKCRLIYACLLILIMMAINSQGIQGLGLSYT